jgi:hypothetical protein
MHKMIMSYKISTLQFQCPLQYNDIIILGNVVLAIASYYF